MLYYLFELIKEYDIPGTRLMTYLSFRGMMAFLLSLLIAFFLGEKIIKWLQKKQIGESIRDLGLENQMSKAGTPTMGGIIILLALIISVLIMCDLSNIYIKLLIFTALWCGGIGFADDYIKVFKKNKEGMRGKTKILLQLVLGIVIALTVCFNENIVIREKVRETESVSDFSNEESINLDTEIHVKTGKWKSMDVVKSTKTTIPFIKNHEFDYKWLSPFKGAAGWYVKWGIYAFMIVLVVFLGSNGTNLADGMDGLSAGSSAIVGVVIAVMAWLSGNLIESNYLNIMHIPGTGEIAVFILAFVGALIGFLWYNTYPAQVFMGDTGSLALGGIMGVSMILIRKELLLPILCGVFAVEGLSVILQRYYFKYTKKKYGQGKRIFKMTPLHHHFQKESSDALIKFPKKTIPEPKIVTRFHIISVILAVATLVLLKVR